VAQLATRKRSSLVHANTIDGKELPAMSKDRDDVSLPDHFDPLALLERFALSYLFKRHTQYFSLGPPMGIPGQRIESFQADIF
jgi:hypothetical protein